MTGSEPPTQPSPGAADAPPTCYRHRDRETYLSCSRCGRPICPDCMTPAAVGQQCPECVAEGRRATPAARTVFGGRISERAGLVTRALIAVNVAVFFAQQLVPDLEARGAMVPGGHVLGRFADGTAGQFQVPGVATGQYYRLVTSAFLHQGVLHIAFNMLALYLIGTQLEGILGTARYLTLYLLSALGGNVLGYLLAPANQGSVGASGAVFGLFAALFIVGRRLSADVSQIAVLIGINLVITFTVSGIDWRGHIGGLLTGAVLASAYAYAPRRLRDPVAVGASAAVALILGMLVVLRTAALTG
jgi:membrane associated rhomboid family serine protease